MPEFEGQDLKQRLNKCFQKGYWHQLSAASEQLPPRTFHDPPEAGNYLARSYELRGQGDAFEISLKMGKMTREVAYSLKPHFIFSH